VRRMVFSKGAAVITAGLLAAGLMAASAAAETSAATARSARASAQSASRSAAVRIAHTESAPSAPTPAQRWLLADQRAYAAQRAGGVITGIAQAANAAPLEGICVTATGPSGARLSMTREDGRFLISGLRTGSYSLEYRDCGHPGRFMQQWYGGTMTQAGSRPVLVSGSGLVPVAPVTLRRPALHASQLALPAAAADSGGALLARVRAAVSAGGPAGRLTSPALTNGGQISGRVTDQRGHPLAGICVLAAQLKGFGFAEARTGLRGYFTTAKLPPGRYIAIFFAACGNTGNWLTQVYKDTDNLSKPTIIMVRAGKTTPNIDAVLRLGGEISGAVTNAAGQSLSNICVEPVAASIGPQYELIIGAVSRAGTFHARGLPAGSYRLLFEPCNPGSAYAPVWWKNSPTPQHARLIRVRDRQRVAGINQVIPLGGKITGIVTAGTPAGPRLAGICVIAVAASGEISENDLTATRANGSYVLRGLAPDSYQVQFAPGCNNNGNYLSANYPGQIKMTYGQVKTGVNGVLPLGAQVSGVVTNTRGHPIGGICVGVAGGPGGQHGNGTQTAADGSYTVTQLPAGTYTVQFAGGCGNPGSYAPQGYHGTNVNAPQAVPVGPAQHVSGIDAVMQPGATIRGRVTSRSGQGVRGACALVTTPGLQDFTGPIAVGGFGGVPALPAVDFEMTAADGRYQSSNLQPGQYELAFAGCEAKGDLAAQWYTGRPGFGSAVIISAGARHPTGGIDVVLQPGGAVSGALRSAAGRRIPGACVRVSDLNRGVRLPVTETFGFGGRYQLSGLVPGAYRVTFIPACLGINYATQWYSRKPSPVGAARVIIRAGRTTAGINSALTVGGSITGLVTSAATHAPLGNVCVAAQNVTQPADFGFGVSNGQGRYVIVGLNSGRYEIEFLPCSGGSLAGQVRSSPVTVVAPRQTRGISAALAAGGSIQGRVTAGSPATPGQALCVDAFSVTGGFANSAVTDAAGSFSIPNLPAGQYVVYAGDPACPFGPYNVVPQWYPGKRSRAGATPVTVTGGQVTSGVDANLALDGSITGSVTGSGGVPLSGVCVSAVRLGRGAAPVIAVTARGRYTLGDLTPGRYRVEFSSGCGAAGYVTQWWKNASSAAAATIITVAADARVTGISAALRR
jgi:hypothetical protein